MSYVLNTPEDQKAMLAKIGVSSVEDLFANIPTALRLQRDLAIPNAMSEMELQSHLSRLLGKNQSASDAVCFLGGGAYDHFIPSVIDAIAGRSEFYTAYTPYQAEASQGTLQAIFEYQTLMCELTGLGVANASLYEGGSSVTEAALMALGITKRPEVLIAESVHPEYRQTLETYAANLNCRVRTLPTPDGFLNPDDVKNAVSDATACVIVQSPNFFGHLEEMQAIGDAARKVGALFVASFDPVSVGVLKRPGDYGADIAVAEGQGLGVPLQYGGPYLGILACHEDSRFLRKIPGRLVGQTTDRNGKRSWVLTLQPREQHIARANATSNICTNQGLLALRAAVYLTAVGPQGLKETAELCVRKAHYAAEQLTKVPGVSLRFKTPFVKEFALQVPGDAAALLAKLRTAGYHAGLPLGRWYPALANCITVAVTEKRTKAEIDGLVEALKANV
ncbi:glycine dehydrogenase subunit 1 : Probable glycine dehydrogenase (decarboxylating) subunit 1 OS=Blastopirellula marina DSM 3645 GN=gcvPA PE=3 SV=1: GDC-P [Gemmata massiliana]|uniref:Probable glycine dehydrogenase (decarboxylating) subunit 1 n=1 Tax=Gemmata massiliana TaxID=1210884 RepID=A0A6P2CVG3_9BACT|nr:aminomethyl-transferring glycine dehydrogenase subunit GcvPA [Gemmata massiliana]VTR92376.1 glycine dehydrogenase subunit 1 : Probable glycine dehydrogenase (decarboxylating) subunit 1 OS=Blastopirellula marina DSM 3645 GN=gcvPA PE=3 SV=1: GDC-P [Gemmata massiliana]